MARSTDFSDLVLGMEETINCLNGKEISAVFEMLKDRGNALASEINRRMTVGTEVEFDGRRNTILKGIVEKVNRVKCKVRVESGMVWTVPSSMLRTV